MSLPVNKLSTVEDDWDDYEDREGSVLIIERYDDEEYRIKWPINTMFLDTECV